MGGVAADHQAVALGAGPTRRRWCRSRRSRCPCRQRLAAADRVAPVGVAAVDDHVARRAGRPAGRRPTRWGRRRGPSPTPPRSRRERVDQLRQRGHRRPVAVRGRSPRPRARPGSGGWPCCRPSCRGRSCRPSRVLSLASPRVQGHGASGELVQPAGARLRSAQGDAGRPSAWAARAWRSRRPARGWPRPAAASRTTWTNTPVGGPPLWSWPVECRKRGPRPTVVATCSRSRSTARAASMRSDRGRPRVDERLDGQVVARLDLVEQLVEGRRRQVGRAVRQHRRRGRLGRGDVGLVEGLDAQQGAARAVASSHSRTWPPIVGELAGRTGAPVGQGLGVGPGRRARDGRRRPRRTPGRRRSRRAPPSGSPTTGTTPVPSLPVDSAISCSIHSPNTANSSGRTSVSLSRPRHRRRPSWRRAGRPGWRRGGAQPLGHGGRRQPGRRRRRRPAARDDAEVATAPSSARRCRAGSPTRPRTPARPGVELAPRVGDDGEAGRVGVAAPTPRPGGCGSRAWSPTWTPPRAACVGRAAGAEAGDGVGVGRVEDVERRRAGRGPPPGPAPRGTGWSRPSPCSRHVVDAGGGRARGAQPVEGGDHVGTTVSQPSRSATSVGSSRHRVWSADQARETALRSVSSASAAVAGCASGPRRSGASSRITSPCYQPSGVSCSRRR